MQHYDTFSRSDANPSIYIFMEIELLRAELRNLPTEQLADLRGFAHYRGLGKKKALQLLETLLETSAPVTDRQLAQQLGSAPGSYRNTKAELVNTVLQWRAHTTTEWLAPAMRQLTVAQAQMQMGEPKQAYATAQKVQTEAQHRGQFAMARMALELKATLTPHVFPDNASWELSAVLEEMDTLPRLAEELRRSETLLAHIGRLKEYALLLRSKDGQRTHAGLARDMAALLTRYADIPCAAWVCRMQARAILAQLEGDAQAAFHLMHSAWEHLRTCPYVMPPSEPRFHLFLQSYIILALQTCEWPLALEAIAALGINARQHFATDRVLTAQHQALQTIALAGSAGNTQAMEDFRALICQMKDGRDGDGADFDLTHWNPHLAAKAVLLMVRTARDLGQYDAAIRLIATVKQWKGPQTGPANDLRTIAPLIDLVLTLQREGGPTGALEVRTFIPNCLSIYDHFRKKAHLYPVEMELARLMRGLAAGSKDPKALYQKTSEKLAQLSTTCHYYRALMQMFDFEAWVSEGASAKG